MSGRRAVTAGLDPSAPVSILFKAVSPLSKLALAGWNGLELIFIGLRSAGILVYDFIIGGGLSTRITFVFMLF